MRKRILIVGSFDKWALERSYMVAGEKLGYEMDAFEPMKEQIPFIRGGPFGVKMHQFLPVEQWTRKMNRKLIVHARNHPPDLILFLTNTRILPGTLACLKTILPDTRLIWIWSDTPLNLESHIILNAGIVDLFATYSRGSIGAFEQLGFNNVVWVPLAADTYMHGIKEPANEFRRDIGFAGGWRPERERILAYLCHQFPDLRIEIQGPTWHKDCKDKLVRQSIRGKGLYHADLAGFFNSSRINLNIIDDTNYPAANMRFFEVAVASGLQLCSNCPEQEEVFRNFEHIIYFDNEEQARDRISWILENPQKANIIRKASKALVEESHTYNQRLEFILEKIGL